MPLFHIEGSFRSGVVLVLEAPNFKDTYELEKGRMTCDPDTDPSGQFMLELLAHVGLTPEDVMMTNAVLCLPTRSNGKHPVKAAQRKLCRPWLERLIVDSDAAVVAAMGAQALEALKAVEPHALRLKADVGRAHPWFGRQLVPLYHTSQLGRVDRSAEMQLRDIDAVRPFIRCA